jgi:hypothetical protein
MDELGNLSYRLGRGFTDEWIKDTRLGLKPIYKNMV